MMKMNVSPAIFAAWHTGEYLQNKATRAGMVFTLFEFKSLVNKTSSLKIEIYIHEQESTQNRALLLTLKDS